MCKTGNTVGLTILMTTFTLRSWGSWNGYCRHQNQSRELSSDVVLLYICCVSAIIWNITTLNTVLIDNKISHIVFVKMMAQRQLCHYVNAQHSTKMDTARVWMIFQSLSFYIYIYIYIRYNSEGFVNVLAEFLILNIKDNMGLYIFLISSPHNCKVYFPYFIWIPELF